MLTAEGIVGKIVLFICQKVAEKLTQIPFDKRKKACRSLTKLYYCVQALDEVTHVVFQTVRDFNDEGDAVAVVNALISNRKKIELATNMFVDLGYELGSGLEIIDPALARCCHTLYIGKGSFLNFMSQSIQWSVIGERARILVKMPQGLAQAVDMHDMYKKNSIMLGKGEKRYWPTTGFDDFRDDFQSFTIEWENNAAAREFLTMVSKQHAVLTEAKERLRTLLRDSFSIEEILFQRDSHPYE